MKNMIYETLNMIFLLFVIVIVSDSVFWLLLNVAVVLLLLLLLLFFVFIHFLFNFFLFFRTFRSGFRVGYSYFFLSLRFLSFIHSLFLVFVCVCACARSLSLSFSPYHLFFHHVSWSHLKLILLTAMSLTASWLNSCRQAAYTQHIAILFIRGRLLQIKMFRINHAVRIIPSRKSLNS